MLDLAQCIVQEGSRETRGRHLKFAGDLSERKIASQKMIRAKKSAYKIENVAVLDMETDPFDNRAKDKKIAPFCACLYSHNFDPIIIWEEDENSFVDKLLAEIEALPEEYIIYAHNGGMFDYMFLMHRLRGAVSFKGRAIMSAKIGRHEIRDSFHIIPERLAAFHKEEFDYNKMRKGKRLRHKQEIIDYLLSDCQYQLEIVSGFLKEFGLKISIGQAAMSELKKAYKVGNIYENVDASIRPYFFGGRVECLQGRGIFEGDYKLYDVNSMYPAVMANFKHPISGNYSKRTKGGIGPKTIFLDVECRNFGALVKRGINNETSANEKHGRFLTTIWEYNAALELGLIDRVKIHSVIDNDEFSTFEDFVVPRYEKRLGTKARLHEIEFGTAEYYETKLEDQRTKLILNNAYGKFAQNPRRFVESYVTGEDDETPDGFPSPFPAHVCGGYAIWERPNPKRRFNNVGTAASITGAARSVLMRAIANAEDPIYCDTDSLICKSLSGVEIDATKLGAWDLEAEFSEIIVTGKKQYACRVAGQEDSFKIRSKGVSGLTWTDFERLLDGETLSVTAKAPTFTKTGKQYYMTRNVRATAPILKKLAQYRKAA